MKFSLPTLVIAVLTLAPSGTRAAADVSAKVKVLAETTKFGPDNDDQLMVGAIIRSGQELADVIHTGQTSAQAIEYATKGFGVPVEFTKHTIITISIRSSRTAGRGEGTPVKVEVTGVEVVDNKLRVNWKANVEPDVGQRSKSYIRAWLLEKFDGEIVFAPAFPKPKLPFVERQPIFKTVPVEFGDTRIYNRKQHYIAIEKKAEPTCVAFRSAREWAEFIGSYSYEKAMQEAAKALEVEYVNFEKQMLLFVYPGQQARSGHHTDVLSVTKQEKTLLVKWNQVYPPSGSESSTGSYRLGELILMEKFPGEVKFEPVSEDPPIIPASPAALAKRPMKVVKQAVFAGKMEHPGDRMPVEKVARNYTELARLLRVDERDAYHAADALLKCGPIDFNKQMVIASSPGAVPGDRFEAGVEFLIRDVYIPSVKKGETLWVKSTLRRLPRSNPAIETHPVVVALVSRYDGPVYHWIEANLGSLDLTPGPFRMPIVARGIAVHPERKNMQAIQAVVKDAKELAKLLTRGDEARAMKVVKDALCGRDVDFSKHTLVIVSRGTTERQLDLDAIETYTLGEQFKQTQTLRDSMRIRDGSVLVHWQVRDLGAAKEAEHPILILLVPKSSHPYQFEAPVIHEEN